MGLLSDVWDYVRTKVNDLISSAVSDVKNWAKEKISAAIDAVDWVINNITKYVTNVYNTVEEYITNVYETVEVYITNVYETVTKYVTNVYNTTDQYITNVIGASQEWVEEKLNENREWMRNFVKSMDPTEFLKDPPTYISGLFSILALGRETGMAASFLAGLEEGLEE